LLSQDTVKTLGNNRFFYQTHAHAGIPSNERIQKLSSYVPNQVWKKTLKDSMADYQDHPSRVQLNLETGFNEKTFTFLLEDHFLTVSDLYEFYNVASPRLTRKFNDKRLIKDVYGAAIRTKNKIKIQNRMQYYTGHVKIHMIKLLDLDMNVRDFIQGFTNNVLEDRRQNGKIPKDLQYSYPSLQEYQKRFAVSFKTNLNVNLRDASKFEERAKIVRTWTMSLPPGSFWEFHLYHHLGKGIHLNKINDLQTEKLFQRKTVQTRVLDVVLKNLLNFLSLLVNVKLIVQLKYKNK